MPNEDAEREDRRDPRQHVPHAALAEQRREQAEQRCERQQRRNAEYPHEQRIRPGYGLCRLVLDRSGERPGRRALDLEERYNLTFYR